MQSDCIMVYSALIVCMLIIYGKQKIVDKSDQIVDNYVDNVDNLT